MLPDQAPRTLVGSHLFLLSAEKQSKQLRPRYLHTYSRLSFHLSLENRLKRGFGCQICLLPKFYCTGLLSLFRMSDIIFYCNDVLHMSIAHLLGEKRQISNSGYQLGLCLAFLLNILRRTSLKLTWDPYGRVFLEVIF